MSDEIHAALIFVGYLGFAVGMMAGSGLAVGLLVLAGYL